MMRWQWATMSLIIRSAYCASRRSGLSFRSSPPISTKSTGERLFKPGRCLNAGVKIAVIGLTTDDTARIGNPEYFTDIEFRKPADEAKLVIQSCS